MGELYLACDKRYWPQAEHRSRAEFIAQQTVYIRGQLGAVTFAEPGHGIRWQFG